MEWAIHNVLSLLIETVQRENSSIIIKVNTASFEWCLSKMSLDKATRHRSELLDHPSYLPCWQDPQIEEIYNIIT